MNVAVFASGGGSNFQILLDKYKSGDLPINFSLVIGNNSGAKAFERAKDNGIDTLHITEKMFSNYEEYENSLLDTLKNREIDIIILAGYMKMIPVKIIKAFENRIINIHPALLPSFGGKGMYGMNVHKAVIDSGVKLSGITVHFVNEEYDKGAIIYQATVPVLSEDIPDNLASRVLKLEHNSLWRVVKAISENRISVENGKVIGEI